MKTVFEKSVEGKRGMELPKAASDEITQVESVVPKQFLREKAAELPQLGEIEVVRHYTGLSRRNYGVDNGFYPLGSCTMKYNPKVNEEMAKLAGFANLHPLQPESTCQGALKLMFELEQMLCEICGFERFSLQPPAGACGEFTGIRIIRAYHESRGEGTRRRKILIPDSSHGTNPASVTQCGFIAEEIKSNADGRIDLALLKEKMSEEVAGIMITNPNTLGLFEKDIVKVCEIVHEKGGLVYMDGANMNALLGICRPGELGFDVMHLNLHKSFSTPHGGGGPGCGPVGVKKHLVEFLPTPMVEEKNGVYHLNHGLPKSIGKVKSFYGNFGMMVRAYTYIRALGAGGMRRAGEMAVLNANYLKEKLKGEYNLPHDKVCMHEFVLNDEGFPNGVTTNEIAKRLLDLGYHAPTIYFPLIVHGAIMIEPTETESRETLDEFVEAMLQIKREAQEKPDFVKASPHTLPVKKLDAVKAAREPVLRWKKQD